MKSREDFNDYEDDMTGDDVQAEVLEEALRNFKRSVDAWSEAAFNRDRAMAARAVRRRSWRLAAGWALSCALVAGSVSGGLYERRHRQELVRQAQAAQAAEQQQRQLREKQAREEEEDLLAKVDSDVSQAVPSAMEPLAQLMADGGSK